jgi:hypothetical protein
MNFAFASTGTPGRPDSRAQPAGRPEDAVMNKLTSTERGKIKNLDKKVQEWMNKHVDAAMGHAKATKTKEQAEKDSEACGDDADAQKTHAAAWNKAHKDINKLELQLEKLSGKIDAAEQKRSKIVGTVVRRLTDNNNKHTKAMWESLAQHAKKEKDAQWGRIDATQAQMLNGQSNLTEPLARLRIGLAKLAGRWGYYKQAGNELSIP